MTIDEQLKKGFENIGKSGRQAQLRWCTVTSVDKEKRVMDAVGESDGLDYFDIGLGTGSVNVYPKPGSLCLIGIVEGRETDPFLISAAEVESIEVTAETIVINGGGLGGLVKVGELTEKLNAFIDVFNKHTHQVSTTGSASAQTGTAAAPAGTAQKVNREDIENKNIQQ